MRQSFFICQAPSRMRKHFNLVNFLLASGDRSVLAWLMMMNIAHSFLPRYSLVLLPLILISACSTLQPPQAKPVISDAAWRHATEQTYLKYAALAKVKLTPYFEKVNLHYPPKQIAMLAFKDRKIIELWAKENSNLWQHVRNYPLTAFSGRLGPKLLRNDGQIPEGIYQITRFNPFSSQHLSMMLNYPNRFDKLFALQDKRYDLGDNIFIHGKDQSVGCLAIGDQAINELFVLVKDVGKENAQIIIAPTDLRKGAPASLSRSNAPKWLPTLYAQIAQHLKPFTSI